MTTYICKCGRRVKKSTDASTTGNRLSGYAPGHECWGCPYAMPYGNFQWDESAKTVALETRGYECRMSKTLTYASEFSGSIKDKCTCRVHSLDFDFLSQVSAWIKDTYPDREIFGSFSKDIRASDYGSDGRYCLTITCAQNLKGVAAKRELLGQFFTPNGSRKDMTPQQEMEKILADIKKAKEVFACAPAQNADAAVTTAENAVPTATAATPTTSESAADVSASTPATSLQNCESAPAANADSSSVAPAVQSMTATEAVIFDFGADDQTNTLLLQDAQTFITGNMARIMAAKHAHDLTANHYQGSWGKWCTAVGISRDTGDNMVRVAEQFGNIQLEGKSILDVQPMKLLYAAAKPSTPEVVKQAVFTGDITTYKEYQELMAQFKAEKERADAAENHEAEAWDMVSKAQSEARATQDKADAVKAERDAALADVQGLTEQNAQLKERADSAEAREEEAWKMQSKAEARAKNAEGQLSGSRQVAEAAKLRADKLQEENAALKKQPIAAVVDEEEVERRANQRAHDIAEDLAAEMTADLQARLEQASSGSEQDARDAYDGILLAGRNISNAWQAAKLLFPKMPPEQRETAADQLIHTLGQIQGEISRCL